MGAAFGSLLRARFRPENYDQRSRLITELTDTLAAAATLGPLPKLFALESGVLHWSIDGLSFVFTVLLWVQLFRLRRLGKVSAVQE